MTAPVTYMDGKPHEYPGVSRVIALQEQRAEYETTRTSGQLWERLSDATPNADALTESQWSRIAIERNYMGTRRPGIDGDARGSAARRTNDSLSYAASGSISQGRLQYSHLNARPDSIFWGLTSIDDE